MNRLPLRVMILVPTLLAIAVGFGAFALFIDSVERENLMADIDAELVRAERAGLPTQTATPPPPGAELPDGTPPDEPTPEGLPPGPPQGEPDTAPEPSVPDVAAELDTDLSVESPVQMLLRNDGTLIQMGIEQPFDDETLVALATMSGTFSLDDPPYRFRVTQLDRNELSITALSLELFDDSISAFRRSMLAGALIILALVSAVVWFATNRLLRPITRMAGAANLIADGALDTEIKGLSGSRETVALGADLDRMVHQLRSVIDDREQSVAEATQARDNMQRFLADVSHELRTPLTALKGYSDLYAGDMLDEPGALDRAMSRIGSESQRLHTLVNDMLQLARQAPTSTQGERLDLVDIVDVVVDDLRAAYSKLSIGFELDEAVQNDRCVFGRPGQLHQALLNIGSNACQHADAGEAIEIRVRSDRDNLYVEFVDHGPGIGPDEAEKIFLPFYRHETARGRDGHGGAGLGLAITHQIVEQHKGTIGVSETPGGGATFSLAFPIAR